MGGSVHTVQHAKSGRERGDWSRKKEIFNHGLGTARRKRKGPLALLIYQWILGAGGATMKQTRGEKGTTVEGKNHN